MDFQLCLHKGPFPRPCHICLTYFFRLSSSGSHLGVVMSCDLTGGGLTFAQIVKLSVPVLK